MSDDSQNHVQKAFPKPIALSANGQLQKPNIPGGFEVKTLVAIDDLKQLVRYQDHSPCVFKDGYRNTENWQYSDFLYLDVDGGLSIEEFQQHPDFKGVNYILYTSRSHRMPKEGAGRSKAPPCDRYHVLLPVSRIESREELAVHLAAMAEKYSFMDPAAIDACRFFFASPDTDVIWHDGPSYEPPEPVKNRTEALVVVPGSQTLTSVQRDRILGTLKKGNAKMMFEKYEEWISLGMALASEGFSEQDWISLSWPTITADVTTPHWKSFSRERVGPRFGVGSLVHWCKRIQPGFTLNEKARKIIITNGDLTAIADECWAALNAANSPVRLMARGTQMVRVIEGTDGPQLQVLDADRVINELAQSATFVAVSAQKGIAREVHPTNEIARSLLSSDHFPLPPFIGFAFTPYFSSSGKLQSEPGYHQETGLYLVSSYVGYDSSLSADDARGFLEEELFRDFPFAEQADRAHAFAMLLGPFVRLLYNGPTPLGLIRAPKSGSGKGLLVKVVTLPAFGTRAALSGDIGNDAEVEKTLIGHLIQATPRIIFDNVSGAIDSAVLAAVLTTTRYSGRVLGKNDIVSLPVSFDILVTANGPSISQEILRRTISCTLIPQTDKPEERSDFRHRNLEAWVKEKTPKIVSCCLSLIQRWVDSGMKTKTTVVLQSFTEWSAVMGGLLDFAGIPGLLENRIKVNSEMDFESDMLNNFVEQWYGDHRNTSTTAADLLPLAEKVDGLLPKSNANSSSPAIALGKLLSKLRNRFFSIGEEVGKGIKVQVLNVGTRQRVKIWRLAVSSEEVYVGVGSSTPREDTIQKSSTTTVQNPTSIYTTPTGETSGPGDCGDELSEPGRDLRRKMAEAREAIQVTH